MKFIMMVVFQDLPECETLIWTLAYSARAVVPAGVQASRLHMSTAQLKLHLVGTRSVSQVGNTCMTVSRHRGAACAQHHHTARADGIFICAGRDLSARAHVFLPCRVLQLPLKLVCRLIMICNSIRALLFNAYCTASRHLRYHYSQYVWYWGEVPKYTLRLDPADQSLLTPEPTSHVHVHNFSFIGQLC
jgi:hypothetical protein